MPNLRFSERVSEQARLGVSRARRGLSSRLVSELEPFDWLPLWKQASCFRFRFCLVRFLHHWYIRYIRAISSVTT